MVKKVLMTENVQPDSCLEIALQKKCFEKTIDLNGIRSRDIFLYGAGDMGLMALELLQVIDLTPVAVIDKDVNKQGGFLKNVKIISPEAISTYQLVNALFVVCIVKSPFVDILEVLLSIGCQHVTHFYELTDAIPELGITNGWHIKDANDKDKLMIRKVYHALKDDMSKAHYIMVLYWRIRREEIFFDSAPINITDKFFPDFLIKILRSNEIFVDCGAYTGNTIARFLDVTKGKFDKIIAFEPARDNFEGLQEFVYSLPIRIQSKIEGRQNGIGLKNERFYFLKRGLSSKFCKEKTNEELPVISLDETIKEKVTFLKMHLEGMEYQALLGAMKTITTNRPIVAITLYHSQEGCYKIPLLLMENLYNYQYYHRMHMYCGQSSVLYAIPDERVVV